LSNALLYNILPEKVADDLRKGKTIEPTFHENVTLFFSDIVGFTNICGQVEPWNVIDMMNQLYSVMDFLADRFNLYKVETVGDSYMCCSGLPEPDQYHAENVANFALAVMECVKHVKSPVTGEPIDLRIGIHTGSCTSGVVGTLTPHYCLFGDMVNFTSRHESTSTPGKIHCSSILYGRLTHFAQSENQGYNLKARGLVDMKGKGEHYTYWLESGSEHNKEACPAALEALSEEVAAMISSRKWKMRKYFKHGGLFRGQDAVSVSEATTSSNEESSGYHSTSDSSGNRSGGDANSVHSDDSALMDDIEDDDMGDIIDFSEEQLVSFGKDWEDLQWEEGVSGTEVPSKVFDILFSILKACVGKGGERLKVIDEQFREYIQSVAALYRSENVFHDFDHASQVVLRANFLWENWEELSNDPWDHFVLLFAALIHSAEHTGVDNTQLEAENDLICQMYRGKKSYQQRSSFDSAFEMLEEDFEELYEEIVYGCPNFRSTVKKLVVQFTDVESEEKIRSMLETFEKVTDMPSTSARVSKEQHEARAGLVLAMATVGHYSQSYEMFLHWNQLDFQEHLEAHRAGRSEDPRDSWYYEQTMFFSDAIVPLVNHVEKILPRSTRFGDNVRRNIGLWRTNGRERVAASLLPSATVEDYRGESLSLDKIGALIATNVDMLESLLKDVAASHTKDREFGDLEEVTSKRVSNPVDEIQMVIEMKKKNGQAFQPTSDLPTAVRAELRDFVITIAAGYQNNEFHNFQHASHVAHLSHLLVKGINGVDGNKDGTGIACDPLARFAIVLSALVHDVGHTGVPNGQLAKEHPDLALKYANKSIAEQNSIDVAWDILTADCFQNLQYCIFEDGNERERLRQLLINCVMATDIFDTDLRAIRQSRWDKCYSDSAKLSCEVEKAHVTATIVIEHIMQASDVAHTMQGWEIYRQWNENLFLEMHQAFLEGRADKDPFEGWYGGELWFFDNWVIPLAQHLKACGVLDIVSDQLLTQAQRNRRQWEVEGKEISLVMLEASRTKANQQKLSARSITSARSSESEVMLTSKIVSEVESLSKVVRRYERKMEAVCGNLIAVAYKGKPDAKQLRKQSWSDIHEHFKQQEWYRMYSDDEFSADGSELLNNERGGLNSHIKGGRRNRVMARGGDDVSSIGSSVSGLRSQLAIAEKVIASSMAA
jgi:class 3 adenylate cyclase